MWCKHEKHIWKHNATVAWYLFQRRRETWACSCSKEKEKTLNVTKHLIPHQQDLWSSNKPHSFEKSLQLHSICKNKLLKETYVYWGLIKWCSCCGNYVHYFAFKCLITLFSFLIHNYVYANWCTEFCATWGWVTIVMINEVEYLWMYTCIYVLYVFLVVVL